MNLFAEFLEAHAANTIEDLRAFTRRMPRHFLAGALRANPRLEPRRATIEAALAALEESGESRRWWAKSDVYDPILSLIMAADEAAIDRHARRLRIQLGLDAIEGVAGLEDGCYRLEHLDGTVRRATGGRLEDVEGASFRVDGFAPRVYWPIDGLFNDLVDRTHYPPVERPVRRDELAGRLAGALELLRRFSPALAEDLDDAVTAIALLPEGDAYASPYGGRAGWSYNLRLRFFGTVFVNLHPVDVFGTVEGLVHEYCHQRIWQWWEFERPAGIPQPGTLVESPVTGNRREACVLAHALLIYASAHQFYRWCVERAREGDLETTPWVEERLARIAPAVPALHERLAPTVGPGTPMSAFLDFVLERFRRSS